MVLAFYIVVFFVWFLQEIIDKRLELRKWLRFKATVRGEEVEYSVVVYPIFF